ncbi:UDP-N-acetylmuramate--L-alanine ligase [Marinilabiliaceae bacterium JC017]|nr:UDP-N-acetylmuramate--L-alanine ligase [Marinilabiliaceae bacterium JC017]
MGFQDFKSVYFIGIGGIGMSALARFFKRICKDVNGYDRTSTVLTTELENEGIGIHYIDDVMLVGEAFRNTKDTLVVYTPAIPESHFEFNFFRDNGFVIKKRAEVLGEITRGWDGICVAGTHGKTTISTMVAHMLTQSEVGCSAFLGGVSNNYKTNYLHSDDSSYVVLEADEFDRSFLQLSPHLALVSAMDADHLDIYGNKEEVENAFQEFVNRTQAGGALVVKKGLPVDELPEDAELFTYAVNEKADFYATGITLRTGLYRFNLISPFGVIKNLTLGIPGMVNVENAVGASALALLAGVSPDELRGALTSFRGIRRRFEYHIKSEQFVFIDDYAHHPEEIKATVSSIKALYPGKKVTGIFQPHLYTRTQDFAKEFAASLDELDQVLLLDIYPARELPIEGVSSQLIVDFMKNKKVEILKRDQLFDQILDNWPDVLVTLGAGDIDKEVPVLEQQLRNFIKDK